MIVNT